MSPNSETDIASATRMLNGAKRRESDDYISRGGPTRRVPRRGAWTGRLTPEPSSRGSRRGRDAARVDARKLGPHVVERLRPDPAGAEVDPPAMQVRLVLPPVAGIACRLRGHEVEPAVARDVEHDLVPVRVGVHRVEDVARVGVEPADRLVAAAPWHDAEPRAALRLPREDAAAVGHVLEAEDERTEEEDHVVAGDREVVHHRGPGDVDDLAAHEHP